MLCCRYYCQLTLRAAAAAMAATTPLFRHFSLPPPFDDTMSVTMPCRHASKMICYMPRVRRARQRIMLFSLLR